MKERAHEPYKEPKIDPVLEIHEKAPPDDEPLTVDDRAALIEGNREYALGNTVSREETLRRIREETTG